MPTGTCSIKELILESCFLLTFDSEDEAAVVGEGDLVVLVVGGVAQRGPVVRLVSRHHPEAKRHLATFLVKNFMLILVLYR